MKRVILKSILTMASLLAEIMVATAQPSSRVFNAEEQEFINLSNRKWQWMADKNIVELKNLFHDNAMFVHMGGSWSKEAELTAIEKGYIWYKHANIHSQDVKFADGTAFVYSNIHLTSEVGAHEVTFSFMVSEVYVKNSSEWQLAALIFTKLMEPGKQNN